MAKDNYISVTEPDWSRERCIGFWHPSAKLLKAIRRYQRYRLKAGILAWILQRILVLNHRFWTVVCACDIPINSNLGGGLKLTHPNGVVIHPDATIGPNCLILQQVTLVKGVRLGGNVDIGAGAKIVKPVQIGDRVKIGANAVVVTDIPSGCTAVGVPAKIIRNSEG